ncbi:hypothetical protein LINGRAHAP2_LOCUS20245 [Linum grandiflorum]
MGKSVYEQTREDRIKANLERMQKLGLKDVFLSLSSTSRTRNPKPRSYVKSAQKRELLPSPPPLRRSSRFRFLIPFVQFVVWLSRSSSSSKSMVRRLIEQNRTELRLQKVDQPIYEEKSLSKRDVIDDEGLKYSKREVYSEEYVKRLGGT